MDHNHRNLLPLCHSSPPSGINYPLCLFSFSSHNLHYCPNDLPMPYYFHSGNETITYCELKTIFPCCLPPAEFPDQKNESSNSLRWWGVYGNISVHIQYKPYRSYTSYLPDTTYDGPFCPLTSFVNLFHENTHFSWKPNKGFQSFRSYPLFICGSFCQIPIKCAEVLI